MPLKTVYVELVAETKKLNAGMKRADKKVGVLTRSFKRLGVAIIGAFGARAVFRGFNQTLKTTEALIKTAKGVGFTAQQYERLTFALSEVGVEASSARIAIGDFQKRLSKAVGGSSPQFAKAFKEAGLDIKALSRLGPAAAFWSAFNDLAGQLDDPRIAGLFGNVFEEQSGKDMLKAARQMEPLTQSLKDFDRIVGDGLGGKAAKDILETGRQTRLLELQWEQLKRKVVADATPEILGAFQDLEKADAFKKMATSVTELATALAGLTKDLRFFVGLVKGIDASIPEWMKTLYRFSGVHVAAEISKVPFTELRAARIDASPPNLLDKARAGAAGAPASAVSKTMEIKVDATGDSVISKKNAKMVGEAAVRAAEAP